MLVRDFVDEQDSLQSDGGLQHGEILRDVGIDVVDELYIPGSRARGPGILSDAYTIRTANTQTLLTNDRSQSALRCVDAVICDLARAVSRTSPYLYNTALPAVALGVLVSKCRIVCPAARRFEKPMPASEGI